MAQIQSLSTHQDTGLSDSTHSSHSSSAERFSLNQDDTSSILLYTYRGGLKTSTPKDLCALLDKNERLRLTRKDIPKYTSYVDVKRHDLYTDEEKQLYAGYPNYNSNLASIKVPSLAYWSRVFLGSFQELYIVSPESSPVSSQADEDSKRCSPTTTWAREDGELDGDGQRLGRGRERADDG